MAGPSRIQRTEKRLVTPEIESRVVTRVDKSIKVNDSKILAFGVNNDYPQLMEALIDSSSNAIACLNTYAGFLEGEGFENEAINNIIVGSDSRGRALTLREALSLACNSVAYNQGFYFQVSINAEGAVKGIKAKPFKNCRFSEPDDNDYAPFIMYYNNWQKDKNIKYDLTKATRFPVFNSDKAVIASQIAHLEEGEQWKGQMYYKFLDDRYYYPLSTFDSVYMDTDIDNQIALYKNRQLRNGFFDKIIVRVAPSVTQGNNERDGENGGGPAGYEVDSIKEEIADFLGADAETVMVFEDEVDPDTGDFSKNSFQIETIAGNVKTGLFDSWETSSTNAIRKAAKNLPAILIDFESSQLGTTSGEAVREAAKFYHAMTEKDRVKIESAFAEIFATSTNPTLRENKNWKIKPNRLLSYGIDNV